MDLKLGGQWTLSSEDSALNTLLGQSFELLRGVSSMLFFQEGEVYIRTRHASLYCTDGIVSLLMTNVLIVSRTYCVLIVKKASAKCPKCKCKSFRTSEPF